MRTHRSQLVLFTIIVVWLCPLSASGQGLLGAGTLSRNKKGGVAEYGKVVKGSYVDAGLVLEDIAISIELLGVEEQMQFFEREGLVYEQDEEWAEAIQAYKTAIALFEKIRSKTSGSGAKEHVLAQHFRLYLRVVKLLLRTHAPEEAFSYAERSKAKSFLEQLAEAAAGIQKGADADYLAEEQQLYARLDALRDEQNRKAEEYQTAVASHNTAVKHYKELASKSGNKAQPEKAPGLFGGALDAVANKMKSPAVVQEEQEKERLKNELKTVKPRIETLQQDLESLKLKIAELEAQQEHLQRRLRALNPRYADLKYPQPVTIAQVQQQILKERDVLVEYLQGDDELYVFVVGKTAFATRTLPIGRQGVAEQVEALLTPVREGQHEEPYASLAYALYQQIFEPVESIITEVNQGQESRALLIVPDETLFYLPFEMLATRADTDQPGFLVDRYAVAYAPSASVLQPDILYARQPGGYARDLLALAPFGLEAQEAASMVSGQTLETLRRSERLRASLEDPRPLPFSGEEVQNIGKFYQQTNCKIGTEATETYLKHAATGNRYLHLATHGYLDAEYSMLSGLVFSDDLLQTYEIFNMDIDAELSVLSACQTGLGALRRGEGLIGLTRAFIYAGSPSVLVSLWSVSDPSTAAFMKRFYSYLNKGMTKAEAMRVTKQWMIKRSHHLDQYGNDIRHDHPFFWAPFILVGAYD